jgi:hypothetical protein
MVTGGHERLRMVTRMVVTGELDSGLSVLTCRMGLSLYPRSINPLLIEGFDYSIFDWNGFTIILKNSEFSIS